MADKKVSIQNLTVLNDQSLVFLRGAVKLLEDQNSQAPIAAVSSVGTIIMPSLPKVEETFIIGPQIFTWKNIRINPGEVTIGTNAVESTTNIMDAVNVDIPAFVIASKLYNVNGISMVTSVPIAKGTGYVVGDILTLADGIGGKVLVLTTSGAGLVETVSLFDSGLNYTIATHSCVGGYGSGCTIAVTAISNDPTVFITSTYPGVIGNSIVFTTSSTNMILNGFGYLGGTIFGLDTQTGGRQRIIIDAIGATPTELAATVPIPAILAGSSFIGYIGSAGTAAAGFGFSVDQREQEIYTARRAYCRLRSKLSFS